MKKTIIASLLLAYISNGGIYAYAATQAGEQAPSSLDLVTHSQEVDSLLENNQAGYSLQPAQSQAGFKAWLPDLMQTFNAQPEVAAQEARRIQAEFSIKAADQASYNPELGVNYQDASDDTYSLAISQTLDWGDKRGAVTRIAQLQVEILLADITLERSQMLASVIQALVDQSQSRKALDFQQQQFASSKRSLDIARQQLQVGDLSSVALQLVQLDVASRAAEYAMAELDSIAADADVLMLLGDKPTAFNGFMGSLSLPISRQIDPQLPALRSAYQQVMLTKLKAEQVKADTSADPSISLSVEREGDENKLGLGLSIPLQFRNNFSDTLAVASQEIAIAEQTYLAQERVLKQQEKKFYLTMPRLTQRYQEWRELVLNSGHKAASGLAQQWRAGDIDTSVYLQSQRQLSSSYLAGLSLETALYTSWLDWMGSSGQLDAYLHAQLPSSSVSNHSGSGQNTSSAKY
ncbi:TolC family protein [Shewanella violacea]|uniref:Outer membrane efflux family protein n=1 Tax=Shewanella violacea (strain JCM 10179 / CIP 106290 / LMG 19151 / DSS12) TaxID=637905 RepID=D4ZCK1_SHEVD|nr:TolC family protein [Shewanella violacea]BAJ03746.1 outer membrane efflux family protein [Shewanella violacea DSS12]